MKKFSVILSVLFFCAFFTNVVSAQSKYLIKNVWKGTYLFNDFSKSRITCENESATEGAAAVWILELVGGSSHTFRLKNEANGGYLYVEDGNNPQCGPIAKTEKATWWIFQQVEDKSGNIRLRSALYPTLYLNNEKDPKNTQCTPVDAAFQSGMWRVEEIE